MIRKILLFFVWTFCILFLLIGLWYIWPYGHSVKLVYNEHAVPSDLPALESFIANKEKATKNIRPGNEAQIHWADPVLKNKTPLAFVYLHGFSASHVEGDPVHKQLANIFGANMYLSRLAKHGIDSREEIGSLTPQELLDSALEAIAIGKQLGDEVVLLGTSTGGTVGIPAMANDKEIKAAIFYSPNIDMKNESSKLLTKPFGLQLGHAMIGSKYRGFDPPAGSENYWNYDYLMSALVGLRQLVNSTMTPAVFEKVIQPILILGYYKNEKENDTVVSIKAMEEMMPQLGTPAGKKLFKKLPSVGSHVMASKFYSQDLELVVTESVNFLKNTVNIPLPQVVPVD